MCNLEQILPNIDNTHNGGSYDAASYGASCKEGRGCSLATSIATHVPLPPL